MPVLGIPRTNESIRKRLYEVFNELNLDVIVEMNSEVVQNLDLEINLLADTVNRFTATKLNNALKYINTKSIYPTSVIGRVPGEVSCRLSGVRR